MANFLEVLRTRQERGLSHQTVVKFQLESNQKSRCEFYSKDLKAHFGCVNALAFSKNGKFLASGGDDRRILIWDMAKTLCDSKNRNKTLDGRHESNVFCIDFNCKLVRDSFTSSFISQILSNSLFSIIYSSNFKNPLNCSVSNLQKNRNKTLDGRHESNVFCIDFNCKLASQKFTNLGIQFKAYLLD